MLKNYGFLDHGARIVDFSSQYHHNSGVQNVILPDHSICWFTSVYVPLPQYAIVDLGQPILLSRIGIFLHGENNQNPSRIGFACGDTQDCSQPLLTTDLEYRGGDHLWDIPPTVARYVRYTILDNFGGSGAYTTNLQLYGKPADQTHTEE
ncbi:F5/8 type C domain-containing protein [Giardia muris]|uniref:F5/8 type C domain-containing protein n=1 Tax=Giardia muris TaxID=5742 RepID=A0A4Z1T4C7_GIAMU|nr:F5/8 type C domain-containing protein [Giardia muris]|eukprot:TNJ30518.1 F5/8 type C domain-containing protein [Giardia muris]